MMASAAYARGKCCSPLTQGTFETSRRNARAQRSSRTCDAVGAKDLVAMRSCWLGEGRRWRTGLRRSYRGNEKGLEGVKQVRAGMEELLHNQVLVSSTVAGILGQLAKPVTYTFFGKGFNWKLILKSGGMPSSHSASVTAAATALGMERGLSDSVFGFSIIMASLVMYDAQGVRRSVGKQAEVINTMIFTHMTGSVPPQPDPPVTSPPNPSPYAIGVELARDPVQAELAFMEEVDGSTSQTSRSTAVLRKESSLEVNGMPSLSARTVEENSQRNRAIARAKVFLEDADKLPSVKDGQVTLQEIGNLDGWRHIPLKESVGHSKVEVFVGAAWGILVSLALHSINSG